MPVQETWVRAAEMCLARYELDLKGPVIVGVSGGKDSTFLLEVLRTLGLDVRPVLVDYGFSPSHLRELADWVSTLGLELTVVPGVAVLGANDVPGLTAVYGSFTWPIIGEDQDAPPCSECSKIRRGILSLEAMACGAKWVALGHNKNDFIVTLMKDYFIGLYYLQRRPYSSSEFRSFLATCPIDFGVLKHMADLGEAATMSVRTELHDGISIVRPLLLISERETTKAKQHRGLRTDDLGCPFREGRERTSARSKRELVGQHLREKTGLDASLEDTLFEVAISTLDTNGRAIARPRQRRTELYPGL